MSTRACGGAAREDATGCTFGPAAGLTLRFHQVDGGEDSFATTDTAGFYSVKLPAGQYQAGPKDSMPGLKQSGPRVITVSAGQSLTADFSYTIQLL